MRHLGAEISLSSELLSSRQLVQGLHKNKQDFLHMHALTKFQPEKDNKYCKHNHGYLYNYGLSCPKKKNNFGRKIKTTGISCFDSLSRIVSIENMTVVNNSSVSIPFGQTRFQCVVLNIFFLADRTLPCGRELKSLSPSA
jgi:hypothetical protein